MLALGIVAGQSRADVVSLQASHDNTLYEDDFGSLSNGAGEYLFAGVTAMNRIRRAVLRFDIAAGVPSGATITGVQLRLVMNRGISSASFLSVHRVESSWGEGASDAQLEEGTGIASEMGDATWVHRFFSTQSWTNPGGDFAAMPSSLLSINENGPYAWPSTPVFVGDVQMMLDFPATNHGWLILADEFSVPPTAKRFASRESPVVEDRPQLIVEYTIPAPGTSALALLGVMVLTLGRGSRKRTT